MSAARFEVSTCRNCFEPVVRLRVEGLREDVWVRWLHTPNRRHCLNPWREVLSTVAEPAQAVAEVVPVRRRRSVSDVRVQGRWAA